MHEGDATALDLGLRITFGYDASTFLPPSSYLLTPPSSPRRHSEPPRRVSPPSGGVKRSRSLYGDDDHPPHVGMRKISPRVLMDLFDRPDLPARRASGLAPPISLASSP